MFLKNRITQNLSKSNFLSFSYITKKVKKPFTKFLLMHLVPLLQIYMYTPSILLGHTAMYDEKNQINLFKKYQTLFIISVSQA
jgi:hypothetical protein